MSKKKGTKQKCTQEIKQDNLYNLNNNNNSINTNRINLERHEKYIILLNTINTLINIAVPWLTTS
jgi:hypothetical protein